MPDSPPAALKRYNWIALGDINAFCGLMLDNIANLVLVVTLLSDIFGMSASFTMRYMIPGTAVGVLVGDLLFTWLAFRTARRTGNSEITAMPLGLDTPSTLGIVLFVVGPIYSKAVAAGTEVSAAAELAWQIGVCGMLTSGLFKLACALGANFIRTHVPRAGLLGSLTAIALALISFIPLLDVALAPVAGFAALAIILTTLTARVAAPGRVPGALVALVVGSIIYYGLVAATLIQPEGNPLPAEFHPFSPRPLAWVDYLQRSLVHLPVVIPFALATVIGGIDCTESAAAAGDHYDTRTVIAVEGFATLVAGCFGGIIQTTPYIGHPAYKAMGARSGYTLGVALFIGIVGVSGYLSFLFRYVPKPVIYPILMFVGLEITAQSFAATRKRHYPAVALACVPALAYLVTIFTDQLVGQRDLAELPNRSLAMQLQTMRVLSAGFIITSMLWASTLAALIDQRLRRAAMFLIIAGIATLFGVIHSPYAGQPMFWPWRMPELPATAHEQSPWHWSSAYGLAAVLLVGWSFFVTPKSEEELDREHGQ